MLMQSLADGQVAQRVRPQVQAVEMSGGHFAAIVTRVMHRSLVPVPITREASVASQFRGALDYDWQPTGLVATLRMRKDRMAT